ncbi:EAL domain-containing protein [Bordetella genomosp. 13]|uniref:EAL domain-containing protein n=1 Tax=Bordetella genomosp. 13 TaxID=463040 RepID=UPI001642D21F|nr:EAL domain-containing protein [Bordetella genomosp. 13]
MQVWRGQHAWWFVVQAVLVLLAPAVLCAFASLSEARRLTSTQADIAARVLMHQAQTMSAYAWRVVDELGPLAGRPCSMAEPTLQYMGSISPYLRSLLFARDDVIECAAGVNSNVRRLSVLLPTLSALPQGRSIASVGVTAASETRPAVIFAQNLDDVTVLAVLDGQYLIDLLNTVADLRSYHVEMHFGTGVSIRSQGYQGGAAGSMAQVRRLRSDDDAVQVSVTVPAEDVYAAWRRVALEFLPATLLLAGALGFIAWRLRLRQLSPVESLRRGMRAGEFYLCYQPIYDVKLGLCMGVEALMRWRTPSGEEVRPDIFIAQAETHGMIVPLTLHLFELIERDVAQWPLRPGLHIGVNLAAEHLASSHLVTDVSHLRSVLQQRQIVLVLEITERSLVSDDDTARRNLEALRATGALVAIDDFGVGNCSLSYLHRFPVDYLKIDRGFVSAIESVDGEAPVLDAIIALAGRLKLQVVAEGVETEMQLRYLRARNVSYIQGYLYGRPMPCADLVPWLLQDGHEPLAPSLAASAAHLPA